MKSAEWPPTTWRTAAPLSGLLGWPLARFGNNRLFVRAVTIVVGAASTALGIVWGYPLVQEWFAT